jgi:histidinol-phosphate aminotransferase
MIRLLRPQVKEGVLRVKPYVGSEANLSENELINISSNESAFEASLLAHDAYINAAKDLRCYPEIDSISLRRAIAEKYGLNPGRVICGTGSDQIIDLIALAYAGVGDEVVYSAHGFQMYPIAAHAVGAMLDKINERTRIVFLANPNNPTGTMLNQDELNRLHSGLPSSVVFVIDAAYAEYVTQNNYEPGIELARNQNNVIMTRTFSKIYALANLRVGWAYGPTDIIESLNRVRPPFNVNGPAIAAAIAALGDHEHTERSKSYNQEILSWFTEEVKAMGLVVNPSVANFVIIYFEEKSSKNAGVAYQYLFDKGIITRRVDGYGLPNWVRVSMGTREEMLIVRNALKEFVEQDE